VLQKRKITFSCQELKPRSTTLLPSHYTGYDKGFTQRQNKELQTEIIYNNNKATINAAVTCLWFLHHRRTLTQNLVLVE